MSGSSAAPDLVTFRELAATRRVVPVVRKLLADGETAVGLYRRLAKERPGTFLLESAEHGRSWSRYSFIGVRSAAVLTERDGQACWLGKAPAGVPMSGDPLEALRATVELLQTEPLPGLPTLTGGMVGMLSYDAVRRFERLPELTPDELHVPELSFLFATELAVLDHSDGSVLLIANAVNYDASSERVDWAWIDAVERLDRMQADLAEPIASTVSIFDSNPALNVTARTPKPDYLAAVARAKEEIASGEAFQIVVSQRFQTPTSATPLDIYRVLRQSNPSPYMYLLRFPHPDGLDQVGFDVIGSSPEALVTLTARRAVVHPIAGTRPRGATPQLDAVLADELLADEKERAEHLMLVDLGRNDLGRVCRPGTVEVVDFMQVERYSHVMHLVSTVVGQLDPELSAYDLLRATFPAGTLSGAPKPRAMELIEELEPVRRGLYAGAVGYFDFAGDLDMAIAIRTALLRDGVAYVQAGAGIVADSIPESEHAECENKAAAVLRAIAVAGAIESIA